MWREKYMIKFLHCDQDTTYLFKYLPDILSLTVTCLDTPDTGNMSSYLTHRMHVRNLSASYFRIFTSISHIYTRGGWQGCSGHWFRHWFIPPPPFHFPPCHIGSILSSQHLSGGHICLGKDKCLGGHLSMLSFVQVGHMSGWHLSG